MHDFYNHPCENCDKPLPIRLTDSALDRDELLVWCGDCLPRNNVVIFKLDDKSIKEANTDRIGFRYTYIPGDYTYNDFQPNVLGGFVVERVIGDYVVYTWFKIIKTEIRKFVLSKYYSYINWPFYWVKSKIQDLIWKLALYSERSKEKGDACDELFIAELNLLIEEIEEDIAHYNEDEESKRRKEYIIQNKQRQRAEKNFGKYFD